MSTKLNPAIMQSVEEKFGDQEFLLIGDISKYLRVSRTVTYSLIKSGDLQAMKIGKEWRIPYAGFVTFLESASADSGDQSD